MINLDYATGKMEWPESHEYRKARMQKYLALENAVCTASTSDERLECQEKFYTFGLDMVHEDKMRRTAMRAKRNK